MLVSVLSWILLLGLGLGDELDLASVRVFRQHQFDSVGGVHAALLLQFINPIGYGFYHFARSLRGRGSLRLGLLLTRPLVLLDYFDSFLF